MFYLSGPKVSSGERSKKTHNSGNGCSPPVTMATWKRIGLIDAVWISIPKRLTLHHIQRPENHFASALRTGDGSSSCRGARVPEVAPTFEGSTSDPKQRRRRFVLGAGRRVPLLGLSTCTVAPTGDANRRLITSGRGSFTSPLILSERR